MREGVQWGYIRAEARVERVYLAINVVAVPDKPFLDSFDVVAQFAEVCASFVDGRPPRHPPAQCYTHSFSSNESKVMP